MGPARLYAFLTFFIALAAIAAAPASAREERCDTRSAIATSIEAIQANYPAWAGKCVKLRGIGFGWKLYADRMALAEEPLSTWADGARAIAIKRSSGPAAKRAPQRIEVIGRVGSCAADNAASASNRTRGDFFMVMGYCHISQANYVEPASIRTVDKAPIVRLTETELAGAKRPFIAAPADLPGLGENQSIARRMIRALQDGDEDSYVRLSEPDLIPDLDRKGLTPPWLRERLRDLHADYVPARRLVRSQAAAISADTPLATFVERADLAVPDERPRLTHCWCKTADCAGRWPVTPFDADNLRDRPYFCVATNDYLLGQGRETAVQARVPLENGGFAEPAAD